MAATQTFPYSFGGIVLTDINCCFVISINGSDSNTGGRLSPYATITKALTSGKTYIFPVGVFNENITFSATAALPAIIGDNYRVTGTFTMSSGGDGGIFSVNGGIFNTLNIISGIRQFAGSVMNCVTNILRFGTFTSSATLQNTLITGSYYAYSNTSTSGTIKNITVADYLNCKSAVDNSYDGIIYNSIDLYNYSSLTVGIYPILNNFVLRKALLWKWNGVIIPVTYTAATGVLSTDSAQWKTDLFNSITTYYNTLSTSTSKTYLASILSNWSIIFPSTTMVVDDINCCPVFNLYSSGSPIDFSLKISNINPALTMSSVSSYVGAYKASITPTYDTSTLKELDTNGNETSNTADILVLGSNGSLYPSPSAVQYRNRIKTNLIIYPRGYSFDGLQSLFTSGLTARYGLGKYQSYTTLYTPQESIEIEPKNSDGSDSTFPKFSSKLNGQTQMWYHQYGAGTVSITTGGVITGTGTSFLAQFVVGQMFYVGSEGHIVTSITSNTVMNVASWSMTVAAGSKYASVPISRINTPILFSDLLTYYNISSDLNMTEYGTWAVTNADYDSYYLYSKTGPTLTTIVLYAFKFWVNINYYA